MKKVDWGHIQWGEITETWHLVEAPLRFRKPKKRKTKWCPLGYISRRQQNLGKKVMPDTTETTDSCNSSHPTGNTKYTRVLAYDADDGDGDGAMPKQQHRHWSIVFVAKLDASRLTAAIQSQRHRYTASIAYSHNAALHEGVLAAREASNNGHFSTSENGRKTGHAYRQWLQSLKTWN